MEKCIRVKDDLHMGESPICKFKNIPAMDILISFNVSQKDQGSNLILRLHYSTVKIAEESIN